MSHPLPHLRSGSLDAAPFARRRSGSPHRRCAAHGALVPGGTQVMNVHEARPLFPHVAAAAALAAVGFNLHELCM